MKLSKLFKQKDVQSAAGSPVESFHKEVSVEQYWNNHNVTLHRSFNSREESMEYLDWRNIQYPGFYELMDTSGLDGKNILDWGCGPGNDLVRFHEFAKPKKITGVEVSASSIKEAENRLKMHNCTNYELYQISDSEYNLPFESESFDYIHSCGVIHHSKNMDLMMKEYYRLLKKDGRVRVLIYNYHSVWVHLYVAYFRRIKTGLYSNLTLEEAFKRSTDGEDCPVSKYFTLDEFTKFSNENSFSCSYLGCAVSLFELDLLFKYRWEALMSQELKNPHREFLRNLRCDDKGIPFYNGKVAGIDLIVELTKQ